MIPLECSRTTREPLTRHLAEVKDMHSRDLLQGLGRVVLPEALERKFPSAPTEWRWQFVFPAARICRDARFNALALSHPRVGDSAGGDDGGSSGRYHGAGDLPHVPALLRDAFAGSGLRHSDGEQLLGHADVSTTMIYTHVLNRGGLGVKSPMDRL